MIKYRPFEFYAVAVYLHPLLELQEDSGKEIKSRRFVEARLSLCSFTGPLIDKFLPSSKVKVELLIRVLDDVIFGAVKNSADDILGSRLNVIKKNVKDFETILDDEMEKAPIFCLERIGNLSTESLLNGAHKGYTDTIVNILTEHCKNEIDESGRCLAYERPTATAFHILRAVEVTIRQYLTSIPGFMMPPLNRQNWGEYIKLLKDNNAIRPIIDSLQNIKDNYRNPLMHPEDTLQLGEAISLFGVCQGMIESLILDMKQKGLIEIR